MLSTLAEAPLPMPTTDEDKLLTTLVALRRLSRGQAHTGAELFGEHYKSQTHVTWTKTVLRQLIADGLIGSYMAGSSLRYVIARPDALAPYLEGNSEVLSYLLWPHLRPLVPPDSAPDTVSDAPDASNAPPRQRAPDNLEDALVALVPVTGWIPTELLLTSVPGRYQRKVHALKALVAAGRLVKQPRVGIARPEWIAAQAPAAAGEPSRDGSPENDSEPGNLQETALKMLDVIMQNAVYTREKVDRIAADMAALKAIWEPSSKS